MSTSPEQAKGNLEIFKMCGDIDLCLRKMKKRNIFLVGLSRSGKSTTYNNINNVTLIGTPPSGPQQHQQLFGIGDVDVQYKVLIENANLATAAGGIASVTLQPNILDKGDYTLSDMAGYMDTRGYKEVIGVSYVLKASFEIVQQCQFAIVVSADYFKVPGQLFRSLKGFIQMFNFSQMSPQTKLRLFNSITFVITKAKIGAPTTAYASFIKSLIPQINNPKYGGSKDAQSLTQILTYLSQHSEQFYLFEAAVMNQKAKPSTIVQDHFQKRSYFQFEKQNLAFQKTHDKGIINLPFQKDFERMPDQNDKNMLRADLNLKIDSVPLIAKILQSFFTKAIVAQNLLDDQLNFKQEFQKIETFNKQYDVYSKQFNNRCQGIQPQKFQTIFSPQDPPRPLKTGINLALNAFQLYKLFNQWPTYNHDNKASKLQQFMNDYRNHFLQIIKLFRNSFCSTYKEQQTILKFLFITARTCRQFSMLYQIRDQGKHEMCLKMKDSFESIMTALPFKEIQKKFIIQLFNNIGKICKKSEQNKQEAKKYIKYLNDLPNQEECAEIEYMDQYKQCKRKILEIIGKQADTPHEALMALYANFIEHKKKAQEYINKMNDDEEEDYPEHINFKFNHLLSQMGHKILSLERADTYAEDLFAYNTKPGNKNNENDSVRLKLITQQASVAMNIFIYINDVESVCQCYEVIIKNIPEKDYKQQAKFIRGLALYCSKNGRIEQSIILYQKALKLCATGNLCQLFHEIKNLIIDIQNKKDEKLKEYFAQLKHKKIIDPTEDDDLDKITEEIEDLFIEPYKLRIIE